MLNKEGIEMLQEMPAKTSYKQEEKENVSNEGEEGASEVDNNGPPGDEELVGANTPDPRGSQGGRITPGQRRSKRFYLHLGHWLQLVRYI